MVFRSQELKHERHNNIFYFWSVMCGGVGCTSDSLKTKYRQGMSVAEVRTLTVKFRPERRKALLGGEFSPLFPCPSAMSRCFPFPPPGYERKIGFDDVNLIVKEKHKEKKHKDKKDKDKKERKERKEKERSEGKHKEDKDRKEKKHRDKKDKKKDKQKSSEDKKSVGSLEIQNGEKLGPDSKPINGIQDHKILVELGKRVRNDGGATDSQMVQKITLTGQRKANLPGKVEENGDGMSTEAYDDIKDKREHSRMDNGQSLKLDARGLGNGLVGNISGENQIKVKVGSCQVDKVEKRKDGKEKNKHGSAVGKEDGHKNEGRDKKRKSEDKKRKKEKKREREKEKEKVKESKEKIKLGVSDGSSLDLRDKKPSGILNESPVSHVELAVQKEPVLNGFIHGNGIRPHNVSRPALSSHQVSSNGSGFYPPQNTVNLAVAKGPVITNQKVNNKVSSSQAVTQNVRNGDPGQTANNSRAENGRATVANHVAGNGLSSSHIAGVGTKMELCQTDRNVAKVEQFVNNHSADEKLTSSHPLGRTTIANHVVSNGLISSDIAGIGSKIEPCQANRNVAKVEQFANNHIADENFHSSHQVVENGRKMAGSKNDKAVDSQRPYATPKTDEKEFRKNGILERKDPASSRPSSASVKDKDKVAASMKPHPDLKYLSQVLTIPKVEWPQFDDQDWLFGCNNSKAKRPKLSYSQVEWTKQVWAEAIQMESADVTVMPYVIPY
ncbi:hypothetical protein Salat_0385400 [Sesamum alatum]|uniref:Uncharacterized protein n=1 Tax=Sesamum alatum TaxID=300844 RepID=A0AAE1Z1G0_9LAMI|nr:hypothetical protein Salat_0385400 [Sesamum alatum]